MTFIGQFSPATRAATCKGCGASFFETPEGYGVCDACDVAQMFSDVYKSDHGFRPRSGWSLAAKRAWLDARLVAQAVQA